MTMTRGDPTFLGGLASVEGRTGIAGEKAIHQSRSTKGASSETHLLEGMQRGNSYPSRSTYPETYHLNDDCVRVHNELGGRDLTDE